MSESLTNRVETATKQIESAGAVFSKVKCADANTMVDTGCGQVPSLRKVLGDLENKGITEINAIMERLGDVNYRGDWAANTAYKAKDQVKTSDNSIWLCLADHTSGSDFNADVSAGKWVAWQAVIDSSSIGYQVAELERQSNEDVFGRQLFYGDACLVTKADGDYYTIAGGSAYVAGIRFEFREQRVLVAQKPSAIWLDVSIQGNAMSDVQAVVEPVVSADTLTDYVDGGGVRHKLVDIANIDTNIVDNRIISSTAKRYKTVHQASLSDNFGADTIIITDRFDCNFKRLKSSSGLPSGDFFTDNSGQIWGILNSSRLVLNEQRAGDYQSILKQNFGISFPAGEYAANLILEQRKTITGLSRASTIIKPAISNSIVLDTSTTTDSSFIAVKDLTISLEGFTGCHGFKGSYLTNESELTNLTVEQIGRNCIGVEIDYGWYLSTNGLTVKGVDKNNGSIGLWLSNKNEAINAFAIERIRAHTLETGILIENINRAGYCNSIKSGTIEKCKYGLKFNSTKYQYNFSCDNVYFESNDYDIYAESVGASRTYTFRNCFFNYKSTKQYIDSDGVWKFENCGFINMHVKRGTVYLIDCGIKDVTNDPGSNVYIISTSTLTSSPAMAINNVGNLTKNVYDKKHVDNSFDEITFKSPTDNSRIGYGGEVGKILITYSKYYDDVPRKILTGLIYAKKESSADPVYSIKAIHDDGGLLSLITVNNITGDITVNTASETEDAVVTCVWDLY